MTPRKEQPIVLRRLLAGLALALGLSVGLAATPAPAAPGGTPTQPPSPQPPTGGCYATFTSWRWLACWYQANGRPVPPQAQLQAEWQRLLRFLRGSPSGGSLVWHWQPVADCESGDNIWAVSPSGTYRGWLQFSRQTWNAYGGPGDPLGQSRELTATVAERYRQASGLGGWPVCGSRYR